ncbi:hypothetical protein, partial [Pseudomonas viridiflava]|uniref:hypothetical protein n=1 Tax=Pseudomonas viridiflava TaxID=33069 RepID=UPI0019CFFF03
EKDLDRALPPAQRHHPVQPCTDYLMVPGVVPAGEIETFRQTVMIVPTLLRDNAARDAPRLNWD